MPTPTYEKIDKATGTGSSGTITFTSIPATYTDLVLVWQPIVGTSTSDYIRFNNDSASNYSETVLRGNGTTATSVRDTSVAQMYISTSMSTTSNVCIAHIMNYANTTTYKTTLFRANNPSGWVNAGVGLWRKTPEAINRIDIISSVNFTTDSTFTLYGIKAA
jgi:hypothetical protein